MFAIFGSGFGLYGYVPALVSNSEFVMLPERYKKKYNMRDELKKFRSSVYWAVNDQMLWKSVEGIVLAQRPVDQRTNVQLSLGHPNIRRIIIEKPAAPTPALASASLVALAQANKSVRIGYSFLYTSWAQKIARNKRAGTLSIIWEFCAHHYRNNLQNWKRSHPEGGGALRFYGIQIIAVLAQLGYSEVERSEISGPTHDDIERWTARFSAKGLPACDVEIRTRSNHKRFAVANQAVSYASDDPFEPSVSPAGLDRRVPILSLIYRSFSENNDDWISLYESVNNLWSEVETATTLVQRID